MAQYTAGWVIAAPFFTSLGDRWIDDFVPRDGHANSAWHFVKSPSPKQHAAWHVRIGRGTPLSEWWQYWVHAWRACKQARRVGGLVTVFPQLALVACIQRKIFGARFPFVAYCFNVGEPPGKLKRILGSWAFGAADLVVVHSRAEITLVSEWFAIPESRIRFVPLQCGALDFVAAPDEVTPFVLAMGSANRDYATLAKALDRLGMRAIIVAAPRCLEGIKLPSNAEWRQNLSLHQCRELAARARINIVPLLDGPAASGQVTVVEAMRMGTPVIATRTIGTVDYIADGKTGSLVRAGDVEALASAITRLWHGDELRRNLAINAKAYAEAELSDEAAGRNLSKVLDEAMTIAEAKA